MSQLSKIAQALRSVAQTTGGPAQHKLKRGLTLTLQYNRTASLWTLSLTRHQRTPSPTEERLAREAFSVPRLPTRRLHKSGHYHIIRLIWKEEPPGQAGPEPEQTVLAGMPEEAQEESYYQR